MPLYEEIKKIEAEAELIDAQVMGLVLEFSHRGAAFICVAALYVKEGNSVVTAGGKQRENRLLTCRVPANQFGFLATETDAEPVLPGDVLKFNGKSFSVNKDGIERAGDVYVLVASEKKRLASGVGG